ncbi:MAG TPA: hypothetical protein VHT01_00560 [Candidatus Udaeobacter sp.]|jgi:hypothetical protein|nr:hypothetical protein [Candidatus Udaeobacter sp.]
MKIQNIVFIAVAFALAFAPFTKATPCPQGGCGPQLPEISIHSTGNVARGNTGSFVLSMNPPPPPAGIGMFVNFAVGGTAIAGVDYVALVSPAFIGQSGYGAILVKTLPNPRGAADCQAYSVVVKLAPGSGYTVGAASSATMWIEPAGCGTANQ